jgi:hypothetical protein
MYKQRPSIPTRPGPTGSVIVLVMALLFGAGAGTAFVMDGPSVPVGALPDSPARPYVPPAPELPTPEPAAVPIDLSGWKLSVPVANEDGEATTVEPATTTAPFLTTTPDGGLGFWAPADGATTANSDHARTELNSLTTFAAGRGVHTLSASVTLHQEPADGRGIIVGQIHGAEDIKSVAYVMVRYQKGRLRVAVKQVQDGDDVINYPLLDGLRVGDRFDFTIGDTGDGTMLFTATRDGVTQRAVAPVPAEFTGATVRFQAGDYQLAETASGADDGGRLTFHRLAEQH